MTEMKINPCPFCGSDDVDTMPEMRTIQARPGFYIFCWNCKAQGPRSGNLAAAIMAWNMVQKKGSLRSPSSVS